MLSLKNSRYEAAATFGHRQQYSAAEQEVDPDRSIDYLKATLMPFNFADVGIPDLDMTPVINKKIDFSQTQQVALANEVYLLVFKPWNSFKQVELWVSVAGAQFFFLTYVQPTEDMAAHYRSARVVSGGIGVKSNTISGAAFSVAGLINHVLVTTLPPISSLTFSNILSYAKDGGSIARNVSVQDGTIGLMSPSGSNPFFVPGGLNILTGGTATWGMEDNNSLSFITGLTPVINVPTLVYNSSVTNLLFPLGATGRISAKAHLAFFVGGAGPVYGFFQMRINYRQADLVTHLPVAAYINGSRSYFTYTAGSPGTSLVVDLPMKYIDAGAESIQIYLTISSAPGLLTWVGGASNTIECTCEDYYTLNQKEPAHLIAISNMGVGQSLDIMATLNYEAVPDISLAQNLKAKTNIEDPLDMELTEAVWATCGNGRLKSVYSTSEYNHLLLSGYFDQLSNRSTVWEAAGPGLRERLNSLWGSFSPETRKIIKKVGRHALSSGSSALGGAFGGPSGAVTLGSLGRQIGDSYFASPAQEVYYASWPDSPQPPPITPPQPDSVRAPKGKEKEPLVPYPNYKGAVFYAADYEDFTPEEFSAVKDRIRAATEYNVNASSANAPEKKGPGNNRVALLSGMNVQKVSSPSAKSASFVIVNESGDGIILAVVCSSLKPHELPEYGINSKRRTAWHTLDFAVDSRPGSLSVETSLYREESADFFAGLESYLSATKVLGSGNFYLYPSAIAHIVGPSHQLAMLAAIVGCDGFAVYTGAVSFGFDELATPHISKVGRLAEKLAACTLAKRRLIFPLMEEDYDRTGALIQTMEEFLGLPVRIQTGVGLTSGVGGKNEDSLLIGYGVGTTLEAWVAQNWASVTSGTFVKATSAKEEPKRPMKTGITESMIQALYDQTMTAIEIIEDAGGKDPSFEPTITQWKAFLARNDRATYDSFYTRKSAYLEGLIKRVQSLKSSKKPAKKKVSETKKGLNKFAEIRKRRAAFDEPEVET